MSLTVNLPLNSVSFGQISSSFLREVFKINSTKELILFPIGNNIDFSSQSSVDDNFLNWIKSGALNSLSKHNRNNQIFKLWHLNGSLESLSKEQILLSFYELDSPTEQEVNIVKNNKKVLFTSKYTIDLFKDRGCTNVEYIPLFFDKFNFSVKDKKYFSDDRVVFNLVGKLEKRKHHEKIIKSWVKRFGNNPKYSLQCSIFNPFIDPKQQSSIISSWLENKNYFNVSFLAFMQKNSAYNDYLNSGDIVIGMSGGEGWGLPEFHSVALGKHSVILNEHSYKEWANEENSVLIKSSGKINAVDGVFFHPNQPFNQGNIFDFNENDFISGCEEAIKRVESNRVNEAGLKLQDSFNICSFTSKILESVK
jgi:hypothetical protein